MGQFPQNFKGKFDCFIGKKACFNNTNNGMQAWCFNLLCIPAYIEKRTCQRGKLTSLLDSYQPRSNNETVSVQRLFTRSLSRMFSRLFSFFIVAAFITQSAFQQSASASDWPQWLGPNRASVWNETGVIKEFPQGGPPVKWRTPIAYGYSGPAVVDGRVYLTDYVRDSGDVANDPSVRNTLNGKERIVCLSAKTGEEIWQHSYDCPYEISYPQGPRCTPTVDSGKVYTLGAEGDLVCLNAENGDDVWSKNLKKEYDVKSPIWGFCAHPLVVGDLLYTLAGGENSTAIALNKNTGEEVWTAISSDDPGYCPPTLIAAGGKQQLLVWDPQNLNSVDPLTGESFWSLPLQPQYGMSITVPRQLGNQLFVSGIGRVGALFKLDKNKPGASVVWKGERNSAIYSANSTPFLEDGMMYGTDCHQGSLIGARLKDGKRMWETFAATTGGKRRAGHGTAFLVKHDDRFFIFAETGDLIIAKLSPEKYDEVSRFHVVDPTNEAFGREVVWTHPAFADRCAFIRNDKEIVCVDLAEK